MQAIEDMDRRQRYDARRAGCPERLIKERHRGWVRRMVASGKLARTGTCAECGAAGATAFHHEEYGRPEQVIELCARCHRQRHPRRMPQGGLA